MATTQFFTIFHLHRKVFVPITNFKHQPERYKWDEMQRIASSFLF